MTKHHMVFANIPRWHGVVPSGYTVDFLGVKIRRKYGEKMPGVTFEPQKAMAHEPLLPPFDEEYFEWIDVIEAVKAAKGQFVMVELGAGYARWIVRAVAALQQLNPVPYRLVAVEPEPTHFEWLKEHLRDNGIDPAEHELIMAAVTAPESGSGFTSATLPDGTARRSPQDPPVPSSSGWQLGRARCSAGVFREKARLSTSSGSRQ